MIRTLTHYANFALLASTIYLILFVATPRVWGTSDQAVIGGFAFSIFVVLIWSQSVGSRFLPEQEDTP